MGVNRMTGSPWHKERVHRAENDDRRYKGRCYYYNYDKDSCNKLYGGCQGSAHCKYYKAVTEEEFRARQKANQKSKSRTPKEDDCYWY